MDRVFHELIYSLLYVHSVLIREKYASPPPPRFAPCNNYLSINLLFSIRVENCLVIMSIAQQTELNLNENICPSPLNIKVVISRDLSD